MSLIQHDRGLSNRQIEELKARLENWQAQLRAAASQITKEGREIVYDSALDVADRALNSSTKEFLFLQAQQRNRLLQAVIAQAMPPPAFGGSLRRASSLPGQCKPFCVNPHDPTNLQVVDERPET
jgi:hypothetical protein